MPLANNAYTDPVLLLGAGITSTIADVWPHCLTLMKTIRLLRILCKEPPPGGGGYVKISVRSDIASAFYSRNDRSRRGWHACSKTKRTIRHSPSTGHSRE